MNSEYMNPVGIAVSLLFVFLILGFASYFQKKGIMQEEGSRKFVHIGVGNWWFIAMIFFDNIWYALSVPALFVVLNALSYKARIFKGMEREDRSGGLGTVYYAIALFLLTLHSFSPDSSPWIGAAGIMVMAYGDGMAAVIGSCCGNHPIIIWNKKKSWEGTLAMFLFSLLVLIPILWVSSGLPFQGILIFSLLLAVIAAGLELVSPAGTDNLTVPLIVSALYYIIWI